VPIAVALGAVVLDERLPVLTLAGAGLALVGVACVLLNARLTVDARRMVP
jgi:drug/metabolite transporter (DMT)-like permease